jgi:hypothetical protein
MGVYIDFDPDASVESFVKADNINIYMDKGSGYEEFVVKGVEISSALPSHFSTDYKMDQETYLIWFSLIADMGANTIKVNHIMDDDFYNAFYKFNRNRRDPLYLLQGIWVTDYAQNSYNSAYSREFYNTLKQNSLIAVDVIHGNRRISLGRTFGSGHYKFDVSKWTLGYIVGTTWFPYTIAYTDNTDTLKNKFSGAYIYTTDDSSVFENMLAEVLDNILSYESKKYKQQRLISFVSEPQTDPFQYLYNINIQIEKIASIDANNIGLTEKVESGFFASYRIYSYYTNFIDCLNDNEKIRLNEYIKQIDTNTMYDGYVQMLNLYHDYPVLVSSYGFSTGRGVENCDIGRLTEQRQGEILAETYMDMIKVGCSGAVISSWQDDWSKKTWNTQHAVDITKSVKWSDYQTMDQFYGLLTFDPGNEKSICYVDGEVWDWNDNDILLTNDGMEISVKYDEKFVYFMVNKEMLDANEVLIIPIDTTPKTGSDYCEKYDVRFQRDADFLIVLNGSDNSRILVQQRYDVTRAMYEKSITGTEPYVEVPNVNTPIFDNMRMILKKQYDTSVDIKLLTAEERLKFNLYKTYETGVLTYGNGNPTSKYYNSLADYIYGEKNIEIRIAWQLLNFSDPSRMRIHDDYYENYGVENIHIDEMYVGIGSVVEGVESIANSNSVASLIPMGKVPLKGWGNDVTYHERLKQSYFIMQQLWAE